MADHESSYSIHMRTGFFRLDPYEMVVSPRGIRLLQLYDFKPVERIFLPSLEIQKVVVYMEKRPELEIITPREVFSGVVSKKVDIVSLESTLRRYLDTRVAVY